VPDTDKAIEDELLVSSCETFEHMHRMGSTLPRAIVEKHLRPRFKKALLLARIAEAERCEAYGKIGSPRVMELKSKLNEVNLEIAKLGAK
jgi:hypothetical protein